MTEFQNLLDFRERLARAENNAQVSAVFASELSSLGFTSFVYGALPSQPTAEADYVSVGTLDLDWAQFYSENELHKGDYALWWCVSQRAPLRWSAYHQSIEQGLIEERFHKTHFIARDHGVRVGATIPILARPGTHAGLSIVADAQEREETVDALLDEKIKYLQLCADLVHARFDMGEVVADRLKLTQQKVDVIRFLAEGLQQDEIAFRMKISVQRVRKVMQDCRRLFDAQTTAQMVGKARFLGIV